MVFVSFESASSFALASSSVLAKSAFTATLEMSKAPVIFSAKDLLNLFKISPMFFSPILLVFG